MFRNNIINGINVRSHVLTSTDIEKTHLTNEGKYCVHDGESQYLVLCDQKPKVGDHIVYEASSDLLSITQVI